MITYLTKPDCIIVKLEGKEVGTIRLVTALGGYQYFPKNSESGNEIYSTIFEVKQSLEAGIFFSLGFF